MSDNVFLAIKGLIVAICTAFGVAFGWLGWLVLAWIFCMVVDWLTGSAAAMSKGEWSSTTARNGIWHKAGMIVVVLVAGLTDSVLELVIMHIPGMPIHYTVLVLPVVLAWYIFTELGSIVENAGSMGAPVPPWLVKMLEAGKKASENYAGKNDDSEQEQE